MTLIKLIACIKLSDYEEMLIGSDPCPDSLQGYKSHDQMVGLVKSFLESNRLPWAETFLSLFILRPEESTKDLHDAFGYPFEVDVAEVINDVVIACSDDIQNAARKHKRPNVFANLTGKTNEEKLVILRAAREQSDSGRAEARMNRSLLKTDLPICRESIAPAEDSGDLGGENLMVRSAVGSWKQWVGQIDKTIGGFGDEELQREVAPGRNRVYYLLGHLTAVHDRLFATLRLGERLHSELDEAFIEKADKTDLDDELPAAELRKAWREVNDKLTAAMEKLSAEQWLDPSTVAQGKAA
jgi:hypothetical protein